jgi:hypothetical protein
MKFELLTELQAHYQSHKIVLTNLQNGDSITMNNACEDYSIT